MTLPMLTSQFLKILYKLHSKEAMYQSTSENVESYYNDTKKKGSQLHSLQQRRIALLSVFLFALTITMLVRSVKDESKGPTMALGQHKESCRFFMDDVATTTEQTKHLLHKLSGKLSRGMLAAKPEKMQKHSDK